jgi:hypothetical protein
MNTDILTKTAYEAGYMKGALKTLEIQVQGAKENKLIDNNVAISMLGTIWDALNAKQSDV